MQGALLLGCAIAIKTIALAETTTTSTNMCIERGSSQAWWQCYDGMEGKSGAEGTCKAGDLWRAKAEDACKGHCSRESGKCGVNSFRLEGDCTTCGASNTSTSTSTSTCPDTSEMIRKCEANGMTYEKAMKDGCTVISCVKPATTSSCNTFDSDAKRCKENNMGAERYQDTDGCWHAKCTEAATNCSSTREEMQIKMKACSADGGKPVVKADGSCPTFVECVKREKPTSTEPIACKKWMENGCSIISCEDGFSWNSCKQAMCQVTTDPAASTSVRRPVSKPTEQCVIKKIDNCAVKVCGEKRTIIRCS